MAGLSASVPDMRPALLITIDVESDNLWARREAITFDNLRQIPRLQAFFERHGVKPTYLLSYPVATSAEGRALFEPMSRSSAVELGSHMHVWTTPPLRPVTAQDHSYCPLATEIEEPLLREKLVAVTDAVANLSGRSPRSHRAGRYALDGRSLRILEELGYTADTSVTSLQEWKEPSHTGGVRGPDFRSAPLEPYFPSPENICAPGNSAVLEIPVSFFLSRPLPRGIALRLARLPRNNNLLRILRWSGLARHSWLRPGREVNGRTLVGVASALLAAGIPVLNVMFHSSEMAVGTSPHTPTEASVEDSFAQLEALFRYAVHEAGVQPMTMSEFAAAYAPLLTPARAGRERLAQPVEARGA